MSDDWIHVVPVDPSFVPSSRTVAQSVAAVLRGAVSPCDEVTVQTHEAAVFYDPGSNWEGVRCPNCHSNLEDAWGDAMDAWHGSGDLFWTVPCCGVRTSLNDLEYGWPCGFARFAVSVRNPTRALPEATRAEVAKLLGTDARVVRQHL
jgi:hypothetical protein